MTTQELKEYVEADGVEKLVSKLADDYEVDVPSDDFVMACLVRACHNAYLSWKTAKNTLIERLIKS